MSIVPPSTRLIRRSELELITGLARSTIYDRLDSKSPRFDEDFPRPVKIGKKAVAWVHAEALDYVATLVRRSRGEVTDS